MKKLFRVMMLLVVVLLTLCVTATAAEPDASTDNIRITDVATGATVEFTSGSTEKIDVNYGTNLEGYYLVMMLTENESGNYIPTKDSIQYIDQATAADGNVEFTVYPKEMTAGKIMLYGKGVGGEDVHQLELATLEAQDTGVTISGSVTTYDDLPMSVTVCLMKGEEEVASVSTDEDGEYSFENVETGTYSIKVTKEYYVSCNVEVEVTSTDADLDLKIYLKGDVNMDGSVNALDNQRLFEHLNGSKTITDVDQLIIADVNENGSIDAIDNQRLYEHLNGSKLLK